MASPAPAYSSSLFQQIAGYLNNQQISQAQISSALQTAGLSLPVADMVAAAVTNGGQASLAQGTSISLGTLVDPFLPGTSLPSSWSTIEISGVFFSADLSALSLSLGGTATVPVTLASQSFEWTASLSVQSTGSGSTTGSLSASLPFPGVAASGGYDLTTTGQTLTVNFAPTSGDSLDLDALCQAFEVTWSSTSLPSALPSIALSGVQCKLDLAGSGDDTLQLTGQCVLGSNAAVDAFVVLTNASGWVLIFGCVVEPQISQLPVVGTAFGAIPLNLDAAVLLVSTGAIDGFQIPSLSGAADWPFAPFPISIQAGAVAGAVLDLNQNVGTDRTASHLFNICKSPGGTTTSAPAGELLIDVQLPQAEITIQLGERKIFNYDLVSLAIVLNSPLDVEVQGQITLLQDGLTFTAALTITDAEITGSLAMVSQQGLTPPLLPGIHLDNLSGLMGINFDQGGTLVAGLCGTFTIGSQAATGTAPSTQTLLGPFISANQSGASSATSQLPDTAQFALLLGVNDDAVLAPVPVIELIMLRVTQLDLGTMVSAMTNQPAPDYLSAVDGLTVSDVLLYYCSPTPPGGVLLPDGSEPSNGFRFSGLISFWGKFEVWAALEVGASSGFNGSFAMSPVYLGKVSGTNNYIVSLTGQGAPPEGVDISGGGATFSLSTDSSPYLSGSADISVYDVSNTSVTLDVSSAESSEIIQFTLNNNEGSLLSAQLGCTIDTGLGEFELTASAMLKGQLDLGALMGVKLGSIDLGKYGFTAKLVVNTTSSGVDIQLQGTFDFEGDTLTFPTFSLDANFNSLEQIPELVSNQIISDASSIFGDALNEAKQLIVEYGPEAIKYVEKLGQDFVHTVEKILGIHDSSPKPSWLQDGALVQGDADPIYEIRDRVLRWVPDTTTLGLLGGSPTNIGDLLLASMTIDTNIVPSRINGTTIPESGNSNLYLMLWDQQGTDEVATKYTIQDPSAFLQGSTHLHNDLIYVNNQNNLDSAADDINQIPNNHSLSQYCLISTPGSMDRSIFFDGIRMHIEDTFTMSLVKDQNAVSVPNDTWTAMPWSGYDVPTLQNGDLVKDPNQSQVYYVDSNEDALRYVSSEAFTNWGFNWNSIITLPAGMVGLLTTGSDLPKKPNT